MLTNRPTPIVPRESEAMNHIIYGLFMGLITAKGGVPNANAQQMTRLQAHVREAQRTPKGEIIRIFD